MPNLGHFYAGYLWNLRFSGFSESNRRILYEKEAISQTVNSCQNLFKKPLKPCATCQIWPDLRFLEKTVILRIRPDVGF